jgi:hypothetical protein
LHDGELLALAMSTDGNYVVGAQLYAKICVWSLEAALKQQGGDQIGVRMYDTVTGVFAKQALDSVQNLHDSNADAKPKARHVCISLELHLTPLLEARSSN